MKVMRVCPAPPYLPQFRKLHKLKQKSFDDQANILQKQNVLLPGGWAAAMESHGFEVFETLYNDFALQAQWAEENHLTDIVLKSNFELELLKAQVRKFNPDVLFIYAGAFFWLTKRARDELRDAAAGQLTIAGLWGDELTSRCSYQEYFGGLDFIFCTSNFYQTKLDQAGIPSYLLGNCFDDSIKFRSDLPKVHEFTFSGVTGYGYPDHIRRFDQLVEIMSRSPLKIWTKEPGKPVSGNRQLKSVLLKALASVPPNLLFQTLGRTGPRGRRAVDLAKLMRDAGTSAESLLSENRHPNEDYFNSLSPIRSQFGLRVSPPLTNTSDYYELLAQSKLVLNLHRDEQADVGNIRCYEATGVGSCLLTDRGEDLKTFFDVENDIVSFNSVDELIDKVGYLLEHEKEIERIAKNGQKTTLSRHTVGHRCEFIADTIRSRVTANASPYRRGSISGQMDLQDRLAASTASVESESKPAKSSERFRH